MKRAFIFLIVVLTMPFQILSMDYTGRWLDNYGDYTLNEEGRNDYRVKRAFRVFERVRQAADKGTSALPRLAVIAYRKGGYSQALPDGGVIINPGTLDLCYDCAVPGEVDNKKLEEGDRRLAFIFGHELAHLANRDFMYLEALEALENYSNEDKREELKKDLIPRGARTKELYADPQGAIFAAMAGYEIGLLLGEQNNFLRHLAEKSISFTYDSGSKHPSFSKRYEFIRLRLRRVIEQIGLFRAGVLLLQMGKYTDAAAAFRSYSNTYPSREVFNNLGVCYLNSALRYMRLRFSDDYFRFRLSTAIDYHTSAEKLYSRGEGDYLKDRDISFCIDRAVLNFREAAYRDRHDRTCRLNLAAALILKKNYAAALAECDLLLEKNRQDVDALNNKAVALYSYGKEICNYAPRQVDRKSYSNKKFCRGPGGGFSKEPPGRRRHNSTVLTQKAFRLLEDASLVDENNFEVLYNRAALLRVMKQPDKAKSLWEKYLNLSDIPRDNFYTHICKELKMKEPPPLRQPAPMPVLPDEIKPGEESALLLEKWGGENVRKYELTGEEQGPDGWSVTLQVIVKQNLWVLAWEGFIVLVEQELVRPGDPVKQLERFGPTQKIIHHTAGTFYIYEEKGFSLKEVDGKVCSYIWFKMGS